MPDQPARSAAFAHLRSGSGAIVVSRSLRAYGRSRRVGGALGVARRHRRRPPGASETVTATASTAPRRAPA